ncbi:hypothetical protein KIW84_014275 [Lathyrus oleraceus]|uniref:Putative plant transposon protein domain-containing protein n=1 Tax=Pisum sativum TaxID=3888 RepID=A0A9D5BMB3_PEA|nr:hypothetical protein KIW84_014275 [Pisum sativum]
MESRSGASKKRKGATTSRTVPIQFDNDKFVGPKQAARYISLEKRKILPEKRFLINPQGTNRTFARLIDTKKWDRLINPLEHYDIATVCEFYANALPDDDEPFTWVSKVVGRPIAFDRDAINRVLGEPLQLGAEERDTYHTDLRLHRDVEAISAALLLPGKSVELNPSGVPMRYHREDMTPIAQLILLLVLTNIQPKSHTSTVPIPVAHLVHSILTNVQIDVARIITNELKSARVRLPSRGQVRIPPPIDDRYVAKYCRAKNARGSAATESTRASDGPGTSTPGLDPYLRAVCDYSFEWMAASQRAMLDMHDSMQRLQLQGSGAHALMTREQFLLNANWPMDRPVYGEGVGAGASSGVAAAADDDAEDDEATGSEAGSEEDSEPLEG